MSFNRMVLFQKKSVLYPTLGSVKKKCSRHESNSLPLASTSLSYALPAANRPAVTCRAGANCETFIGSARTLIARGDIKGWPQELAPTALPSSIAPLIDI